MQIILFIGIPGSGKSTFYQQHFFHTHLRINLDMLRTRNRENKLLDFCFQTQMPCVVDNTNIKTEDRRKYIELAKQRKYTITGYYFESTLKDSLERNAGRTGKQQVSEKGIKAKYYGLQIPSRAEGFDELYCVRVTENLNFEIEPRQDVI